MKQIFIGGRLSSRSFWLWVSCKVLDLENLAEEIVSLGRQERQELENRLGVLIGHY